MPYDDPVLKELGGYLKAREPDVRERAEAQRAGVGRPGRGHGCGGHCGGRAEKGGA